MKTIAICLSNEWNLYAKKLSHLIVSLSYTHFKWKSFRGEMHSQVKIFIGWRWHQNAHTHIETASSFLSLIKPLHNQLLVQLKMIMTGAEPVRQPAYPLLQRGTYCDGTPITAIPAVLFIHATWEPDTNLCKNLKVSLNTLKKNGFLHTWIYIWTIECMNLKRTWIYNHND